MSKNLVLPREGKKDNYTAHFYTPEIFPQILDIVKISGKSRF